MGMKYKSHSLRAKLLLALAGSFDAVPFTRSAAIVAAWRRYPQDFGLDGYEHPDSTRVISKLYGGEGLEARGMMTIRDDHTLVLTPHGLDTAARLRRGTLKDLPPPVHHHGAMNIGRTAHAPSLVYPITVTPVEHTARPLAPSRVLYPFLTGAKPTDKDDPT